MGINTQGETTRKPEIKYNQMYINKQRVKLWTSCFIEYCRPVDTIEDKSLRPTLSENKEDYQNHQKQFL